MKYSEKVQYGYLAGMALALPKRKRSSGVGLTLFAGFMVFAAFCFGLGFVLHLLGM